METDFHPVKQGGMQARIEGPFHEEGALGNGPGLKNATEPAFVNSVLDSRQVAEDHFRTLPPPFP